MVISYGLRQLLSAPLLLVFERLLPGHFFSAGMLALWFLDVCFQVTSFRHNCKFGNGFCHFWRLKPIIWQAWCLHFGTLGHLHGSSRKDTSESGIGFLLILGRFWDPMLQFFWAPRAKNPVCFALVSRFYFSLISECKSGFLELTKARIWCKRYCKNQVFAEVGILMILGSFFCVFRRPWGYFFSLLLPWRQA